MKKWTIAVIVAALVGTGFMVPSDAKLWPFGKDKEGQEQESTGVEEIEVEEESQPREPIHRAEPQAPTQAVQAQPKFPGSNVPKEPASPQVKVVSPVTKDVKGMQVASPVVSSEAPPEKTYVTIDDPKNPLGVTQSAEKLNQAALLIKQKQYEQAREVLYPLKDWLVDATEVHINLHKTLKGIPSAQVQAELEKQLALQFAMLRDKAFFQLGMMAVGEEDYSAAIKHLSRVVQSQPRSPIGAKAYEILQKIGFTEKIQLREKR